MRRRLVVAIAGVAVLAVVFLAVPLAIVLQRVHRDEELLRLQRDTVAATRGIDVTAARADPVELPDAAGLAVYDIDGQRLAGRGGPPTADDIVRDVLRRQAPAARARDGRLVVAVPLVTNEQVTGVVPPNATTRRQRGPPAANSGSSPPWSRASSAKGPDQRYGMERVAAAIRARAGASPNELLEHLCSDVIEFASSGLDDDLCLIAMRGDG